ncbi:MAG TPA: zf-HC2 domain-containing protein [Actinomycetota bacterium]
MTPSTHPEDLLAGHVEGALREDERAAVEAHLTICRTCREEVELARTAVRALGSLPEEPVPVGVMKPVTSEIDRQVRKPARMPWLARLQWAGGLAAAAALVALLAVTLPRLGGGADDRATGGLGAGAEGGAASPAVPAPAALAGQVQLEDQPNLNYDAAKLQALAAEVATQARGGQEASFEAPKDLIPAATSVAQACVAEAAGPTGNDRLVRLIRTRFEGTPAYLGVYLAGPGAGQPPSKVVIWVAAQQGCRILSFSSQRL